MTPDKPALDAATLAAVREAIFNYRGAVASGSDAIMAYDLCRRDMARMINDMINLPAAASAPLTPAQTAEVERIVAQRIAEAKVCEAFAAPTTGDLTHPPAPPPPKRVEAWIDPVTGCVSLFNPHPVSGWTYLTTNHGVTDAASAKAKEAAIRFADRALQSGDQLDRMDARRMLAPFLPETPR